MSRKSKVRLRIAAGAVVVGALLSFLGSRFIAGPKPWFPENSGVLTGIDHGPIPPTYDDGDPAVAVVSVGRDSVWFYAEGARTSRVQSVHIRVGESAALDGVTITLCARWFNPWAEMGGALTGASGNPPSNPSMAYYVTSYDGSVPTCP